MAGTETVHLDFDVLFSAPIKNLRVGGSYPDIPRNFIWVVKVIVMQGLSTAVGMSLLYSTVAHDLKKDLTRACANGALTVIYFVVLLKYTLLVTYQKMLMGLINSVKKDFNDANTILPPEEKELVVKYALHSRVMIYVWCGMTLSCCLMFFFKPLILMGYYGFKGEFRLVEYIPLTYPEPIERLKFHPLVFSFIFLMFLWFDIYNGTMYIGVVTLGPIFMLHACGQLEILILRVKKIFPETGNQLSFQEREVRIKSIIQDIQRLYRFVQDIQTGFMFYYEVSLKSCCIILPVSIYQVVETSKQGQLNVEFVIMGMCTVFLSGIPCYYSDKLTEMGESFREAVYMCNWEKHWDKRMRSTLLIMMTRAQRTMAIRSMFRTIGLATLTEVYQMAYAIFNFMIAVWG